MFGKKKNLGKCIGYYTGEGVIDGVRFNKRGGKVNGIGGVQVEVYGLEKNVHAGGNMRYPVYEYEVDGVVYRRAREHVSYSDGRVKKMKGKQCIVIYDVDDAGKSKVK